MAVKSFIPFPELETERLKMRQLTPADAEAIYRLRSDPEQNKHLDRVPAEKLEDAANFIKKITDGLPEGKWIFWAVTFKGSDELLGTVTLWQFSEDRKIAELGYELLPEFTGKGIMRESVAKAIEYGFDTIGLNKITAEVAPGNERSVALLRKFGFTLPEELRGKDVSTEKTVVYELSRESYNK